MKTPESDKNLNTVAPIQSITDYLCPPEGTRGTDFLGNDVRKQKENKGHNDLPESSFENVYKPDQLVTLDQLFSMNLMKNYSQVVSSLDIIHHEEFLDITGTLTIGVMDPWTVSNKGFTAQLLELMLIDIFKLRIKNQKNQSLLKTKMIFIFEIYLQTQKIMNISIKKRFMNLNLFPTFRSGQISNQIRLMQKYKLVMKTFIYQTTRKNFGRSISILQ